jgi:hypothetical protein
MSKKPTYEELVPEDVRELAAGVGLPDPTWYQGRTNGHGQIEEPKPQPAASTVAADPK